MSPSIKNTGFSRVATESPSEKSVANEPSTPSISEKGDLYATSQGILYPVHSLKTFLFAVLASCTLLFWLLTACLPAIDGRSTENLPSTAVLVKGAEPLKAVPVKGAEPLKAVLAKAAQPLKAVLVKDAEPAPAQAASPSGLLEVFQVYQPVLTPRGVTDETIAENGSSNTTAIAPIEVTGSCQALLMEHSFAFSYGLPFVGNYTPPECKFNRVTMNFTVTSRGRQFDRIALMYFGDTEVWRTSTAEPSATGIRWEYIKDMSHYLYFWNSPQTLIFDLGNLIDSTYTAPFNTTLTATFFMDQETDEPASLIIPISTRRGADKAASVFTLPADNATTTVSLPRNANRAVFSVSACGQMTEEFWWSNVLQSVVDTFGPDVGTLYGYSPFREVQVLIDGQLAGVHWPFPVIFTGGINPGLWRPIVGIDAFDLREHEIDITPWLPILSDGAEHSFEIRVVGIVDDGKSSGTLTQTVGSSWLVTGKIFLWLDEDPNSITAGEAPKVLLPEPTIELSHSVKQNSTGANETLTYNVNVKRSLSVSSVVTTQSGRFVSTWTQSLSVTNYGGLIDFGAMQLNNQTTTGNDASLGAGGTQYKSSYTYPLYANSTYSVQPSGNFTIEADLQQGLDLAVQGKSVFPTGLQPFARLPESASLVSSALSGTFLSTRLKGIAQYFGSPAAGVSRSSGRTSQEFSFTGTSLSEGTADSELYYRNVDAVNATVVRDYESLVRVEIGSYERPEDDVANAQMVKGVVSPKAALGRGFGEHKELLVQTNV
ncbi:uncharacterized protein L3040_001360 [Drepanopeziza brunnea f. sp. 'multigermtubi']|uniref:uncharacterized protein n=1 Tax=Drepanopeziza brunnea f. sp. 'multigermtubi' TaxID=698441 RepID=UPI00239608E4|nr:hypothetical protein L3040_001360 [Drepanopeziza brunnea f. sp. 'multigermtubi']